MYIGIGDWVLTENYAKYAVLSDTSHFVVSVEVPFYVGNVNMCLNYFTIKIAQFIKNLRSLTVLIIFRQKVFQSVWPEKTPT